MVNKLFKNLNKILKDLKWWLLPMTLVVCVCFFDAATDSEGISRDEEGLMYGAWLLVIVNVGLFVFNKKWQKLIDSLIKQH